MPLSDVVTSTVYKAQLDHNKLYPVTEVGRIYAVLKTVRVYKLFTHEFSELGGVFFKKGVKTPRKVLDNFLTKHADIFTKQTTVLLK